MKATQFLLGGVRNRSMVEKEAGDWVRGTRMVHRQRSRCADAPIWPRVGYNIDDLRKAR